MQNVSQYPPYLCSVSTTIDNGQTASSAIDLAGTTLVGIQMPTSFTGTSISFEVATAAGGTYQQMISSNGSAVSKTVSQGKFLTLDPTEFASVQFLKVVSSDAEGAERAIELVARPV